MFLFCTGEGSDARDLLAMAGTTRRYLRGRPEPEDRDLVERRPQQVATVLQLSRGRHSLRTEAVVLPDRLPNAETATDRQLSLNGTP